MGRQGEIFAGFFTASGRAPGGETAVAKARRKKEAVWYKPVPATGVSAVGGQSFVGEWCYARLRLSYSSAIICLDLGFARRVW